MDASQSSGWPLSDLIPKLESLGFKVFEPCEKYSELFGDGEVPRKVRAKRLREINALGVKTSHLAAAIFEDKIVNKCIDCLCDFMDEHDSERPAYIITINRDLVGRLRASPRMILNRIQKTPRGQVLHKYTELLDEARDWYARHTKPF